LKEIKLPNNQLNDIHIQIEERFFECDRSKWEFLSTTFTKVLDNF